MTTMWMAAATVCRTTWRVTIKTYDTKWSFMCRCAVKNLHTHTSIKTFIGVKLSTKIIRKFYVISKSTCYIDIESFRHLMQCVVCIIITTIYNYLAYLFCVCRVAQMFMNIFQRRL